jgi:fatty acid desaturase
MTGRRAVNAQLIIETLILFLVFVLLANYLGPRSRQSILTLTAYLILLFAQGLLLQRIYIIGHEAAHKKLDARLWVNDSVGQIILSSIFVPFGIFRKIHQFHHGFNRKDWETSALDVFISPWPVTPLIKVFFFVLWYLGVFAGGLFLHSVASIVVFLIMPIRLAQRISPAFKRWSHRDRLIAWIQFLGIVLFHISFIRLVSFSRWLYAFGLPLVTFAWIWSMLVYVFHYDTTIGRSVRFNVRSINANWFTRWWLMNFNLHASHHMFPNVPWYELPEKAQSLPQPYFDKNQSTDSLLRAVINQLKGPLIVFKAESEQVQ